MTASTKPYLIRAIHEWCLDQGFTPYLAAIVDEHARVPAGYARDGQIVLNVSPDATHQLQLGNDLVTFQARFGGVAFPISIPTGNVVAIYARENGHGMAFEPEAPESGHDAGLEAETESTPRGAPPAPAAGPDGAPGAPARSGHLKVIK